MKHSLNEAFRDWLTNLGLSENMVNGFLALADFTVFLLIIATISIALYLVLNLVLHKIVRNTSTEWDDALLKNRVFGKLLLIIPAILITMIGPTLLGGYPTLLKWVLNITHLYMIILTASILLSFLNSVYDIYQEFEVSRVKSIKSYIQVFKIAIIILTVIVVIATLINKSPLILIGGMGAFSAVLLLIFKDPILGLVGGVQLSANDMVRIGDWVTIPKSNTDGEVKEISLTAVKVENWDKSLSMIPTYTLVSESFVNHRNMKESGGRRIKRSIQIDMNSVKFATQEMLEKFSKIQLLEGYLSNTQQKLEKFNQEHQLDNSVLVNGRRQTNLGIFRAYLLEYLKNNPHLRKDFTYMVRQLQPTETGIPLEIYLFSAELEWVLYEDIQSDIFDHILASVPEFELRVFQNPSGADFQQLSQGAG